MTGINEIEPPIPLVPFQRVLRKLWESKVFAQVPTNIFRIIEPNQNQFCFGVEGVSKPHTYQVGTR